MFCTSWSVDTNRCMNLSLIRDGPPPPLFFLDRKLKPGTTTTTKEVCSRFHVLSLQLHILLCSYVYGVDYPSWLDGQ
jgi:hypothetical protein